MSAVRIENEAFGDKRFDALAKLCQLADAEHALGKMSLIWRECTDRHSYVLPETFICIVLGDNGPLAIEKSGLGERVEGGIRIRGTKGRIEWLKKLKKNASKGGKARASQMAAKRQARASQEPAKAQPSPSPLTLSITPSLTSQNPEGVHQVAVEAFDAYYRRAHANAKPTWDAVRVKQVKTLVGKHGVSEILRRLDVLERTPPSFPPAPWDLGTFIQHFDKCAAPTKSTNGRANDPIRHIPDLTKP